MDFDFDKDKVDEYTLALLFLTAFEDNRASVVRAWKGFDWDTMDRLHEKGYISNPKGKTKSVKLTDEGERLMIELFRKHFGRDPE